MITFRTDEEKDHSCLLPLRLVLVVNSVCVSTLGTSHVRMGQCRVRTKIRSHSNLLLCDSQQIVPVHTFVLANLVVITDPAGVDHDSTCGVSFWIEQVVTFGAKVE